MKTRFFILPLLLLALLLTQCKPQTTTTQDMKRQWMLVSFLDYSKDFLMKNKAEINLTTLTDESNSGSAFMGCNNLMITANFKPKGEVSFGDIASTMMFCEGKMSLEKQFIFWLPQMKSYKIDGHYLTLTSEDGKIMKFVAADWD